jgi:hypothetical protein
MSVFGNIMSAIFGSKHAASVTAAGASSAPPSSTSPASGSPSVHQVSKADVRAILEKLDKDQDEELNWKDSIIDLMKLLKLDSSLRARKQLARELGYTGTLNGSARMNIWLHKQVMTKLVEGGGKMPENIKKRA